MQQIARLFIQSIGLYEIIGGAIGVFISAANLVYNPQINIFWLLYTVIALLLFCFCIYAGIETVNLKPLGITLSVYVQLLQVVSFSILGFAYTYNSGLGVFLGIDMTSSVEYLTKVSSVKFGMGKADATAWKISINIIPLAILLLIQKAQTIWLNTVRLTSGFSETAANC